MSADPDDIAAVEGDPTPTDPATIDLEAVKECQKQANFAPSMRAHVAQFVRTHGPALIATVEALRARVTDVENRYKLYKNIAKGIRGVLDGEHTQRDILREFDIVVDRAEAAEAYKMELAEHLDKTIATAADAVNRMNAAEAEIKQLRGYVAELAQVLKAQCDLIKSNPTLSACASSTLEPAHAVLAALPWAVPLFTRLEEPAGKRD